jgi:transposase
MKTNPNHGHRQELNASDNSLNSQLTHTFKLGLDVDIKQIVAGIQCDHESIKPAAHFTKEKLISWVKEKVTQGHTIWTVYESCGFGYTLHYELVAAGAQSLVITPVRLHQERRRKNDRLDARELCVRLSRYVDGQRTELPVIRIPTAPEQQRRELGRQREFWKRELRRIENHGRALRIEHEHQTLRAGWAGPRIWKRLAPQLSEFVRTQLEPMVEQIRLCQQHLQRLSGQIEAFVAHEKLPVGLGALTLSLADGEVCDWHRFKHRKAPSSYTGCCPSEYSTGGVQRTGSIDRHGNKLLRVILIEAVWRLLRLQPNWHAYKKLIVKIKAGAVMRKKMAVALARQLAVDLWRWRTGRCSLEQLGFVLTETT